MSLESFSACRQVSCRKRWRWLKKELKEAFRIYDKDKLVYISSGKKAYTVTDIHSNTLRDIERDSKRSGQPLTFMVIIPLSRKYLMILYQSSWKWCLDRTPLSTKDEEFGLKKQKLFQSNFLHPLECLILHRYQPLCLHNRPIDFEMSLKHFQ